MIQYTISYLMIQYTISYLMIQYTIIQYNDSVYN